MVQISGTIAITILVKFLIEKKEQQLIKVDNSNVGNLLMSLRRHQPASAKVRKLGCLTIKIKLINIRLTT
jgi:hypothetical protein